MPSYRPEDSGTYAFAPRDPVEVSSAAACSTTLNGEKKEAVKTYLNKLGPELQRRYGRRDHYLPEQVRDTTLAMGLSVDWMCWAYVLFCTAPDFERIHAAAGEVCDRDGMWGTVAGEFFNGNTDFDPAGVADTILSVAGGAGEITGSAVGWLADVDWGSLLDWG